MGHTKTPKFELQFEIEGGDCLIEGADTFKEAYEQIKSLKPLKEKLKLTGNAFLWGNSRAGWAFMTARGIDFFSLNFFRGEDFKGQRL